MGWLGVPPKVYEVAIYDLDRKLYRILNLTTGAIYPTDYATKHDATDAIARGVKASRGKKGAVTIEGLRYGIELTRKETYVRMEAAQPMLGKKVFVKRAEGDKPILAMYLWDLSGYFFLPCTERDEVITLSEGEVVAWRYADEKGGVE